MGWVLIILGFAIAMTATALLVLGKIGTGLGIIIGALGIGLIAISGRRLPKEDTGKTPGSKGS
jgi:hypothetical protein